MLKPGGHLQAGAGKHPCSLTGIKPVKDNSGQAVLYPAIYAQENMPDCQGEENPSDKTSL